jgi:hypothetical protein
MKRHSASCLAGSGAALVWLATEVAAAGVAAAQTIRPPEKGDQLVPEIDRDDVIRVLARYEVVFAMGIMVVVAIILLLLYKRYYSRYLPRVRFRPPAAARVGAPVAAIYGLVCGLGGLFALSGNPMAIQQAAALPASCLVVGGLALTGLGLLVPFGNRMAGVLLVALLAADFAINILWAVGNLESIWQMTVRVWCGAGIGLLAIWSVAAVFQRWGRIQARERDVHRLVGPR